jgi:hypothetical protein
MPQINSRFVIGPEHNGFISENAPASSDGSVSDVF